MRSVSGEDDPEYRFMDDAVKDLIRKIPGAKYIDDLQKSSIGTLLATEHCTTLVQV